MTRCGIALAFFVWLLLPRSVTATPLDKASCEALKAEQGQLDGEGTRTAMAKGPQWAKANLKPEQIDHIRRIIEVDGQLLFRCNGHPLVALPKEIEADDLAARARGGKEPVKPDEEAASPVPSLVPSPDKPRAAPKQKAATAKDGPAPGVRKPLAKKAPAAPAVSKAGAEAGGRPAAAGAGAKQKPKVRVDDAFKPPVADPATNPFANQLPQTGKD